MFKLPFNYGKSFKRLSALHVLLINGCNLLFLSLKIIFIEIISVYLFYFDKFMKNILFKLCILRFQLLVSCGALVTEIVKSHLIFSQPFQVTT